jgi:flagellar biogenesis protein FliO
MFSAARNSHANRFAPFGLIVVVAVMANAARAQDRDTFGPPAFAPITSPALDDRVDQPVAENAVPSAEQIASPDEASNDAPATKSTSALSQSNSLTGSRSLGAPPQSTRWSAGAEREAQADAKSEKGMGKTAAATAMVLALIVVVALAIRAIARRQGGLMAAMGPGGRAPGGLLEVLGRFPIGRGQTLVLLKIDRRVLLLSQSSGGRLGAGAGMNTLCEITDPEEVASILIKGRDEGGDSMAHRFRSMLAGQSNTAALQSDSASAGRAVFENDAGDSTEIWDESQAIEAITDRADSWPTGHDHSALGSLRTRLEHWRDVEASR